jgi:DNA-directed RNA polymerase subunit RPC12/RpoP
VTDFTREIACSRCGREYLVSGAAAALSSETEALANLRCSCGQWMGAFVPGSANLERLIVTLKSEGRQPG